jgi:hypothetical protein
VFAGTRAKQSVPAASAAVAIWFVVSMVSGERSRSI